MTDEGPAATTSPSGTTAVDSAVDVTVSVTAKETSSTTLASRADALAGLLDRWRGLRTNAERVAGYSAKADKLRSHRSLLEPLAQAVRVYRARGIVVGEEVCKSAIGLQQSISKLAQDFQGDRATLIDESSADGSKKIERQVDQIARKVTASLTSAWQAYVDSKRPSIDAGLLDVFGRVPAFASAVGELRRLRVLIDMRRTTAALVESDFVSFDQLCTSVEGAWKALEPVGTGPASSKGASAKSTAEISPAVRSFIVAASSPGGASLAALTAEVRDWLDHHGVSASFRIVVR